MKSYDKYGGENLTWKIKFRAWDKEENEMIYDVQNTYDYHCSGQGLWKSHLVLYY